MIHIRAVAHAQEVSATLFFDTCISILKIRKANNAIPISLKSLLNLIPRLFRECGLIGALFFFIFARPKRRVYVGVKDKKILAELELIFVYSEAIVHDLAVPLVSCMFCKYFNVPVAISSFSGGITFWIALLTHICGDY